MYDWRIASQMDGSPYSLKLPGGVRNGLRASIRQFHGIAVTPVTNVHPSRTFIY